MIRIHRNRLKVREQFQWISLFGDGKGGLDFSNLVEFVNNQSIVNEFKSEMHVRPNCAAER